MVNAKIPVSLFNKLEIRLRRFLQNHLPNLCNGINLEGDEVLAATIESLQITEEPIAKLSGFSDKIDNDNGYNDIKDTSGDIDVIIEEASSSSLSLSSSSYHNYKQKQSIKVFLYKYPEESQSSTSTLSNNRTLETNPSEDSSSPFYSLETFPNSSCRGLWDSLEFDSNIKSSVLAYLTAIFRFSLLGLTQQNEISFNRILLLHGPPGTGTLFDHYH